jgi:hypothetical protein
MKISVAFELTACGRCGGCGEYSFNLRDGSTCYGCSGSGKALSRAGKAARKAYEAVMSGMTHTYADVKREDRVRPPSTYAGPRMWRTVADVEIFHGSKRDGVPTPCYRLTFTNGESVQALGGTTPIDIYDRDVFLAAVRRVVNLKGAVVTGFEEEPAPAVAIEAAPRKRGSHATCDHESTPAARAKCRASR